MPKSMDVTPEALTALRDALRIADNVAAMAQEIYSRHQTLEQERERSRAQLAQLAAAAEAKAAKSHKRRSS